MVAPLGWTSGLYGRLSEEDAQAPRASARIITETGARMSGIIARGREGT